MASQYRGGSGNISGGYQKAHSTTAKVLIIVFAAIAVASVGWQAWTLLETGIRESMSIADLTGYVNARLTGQGFLDGVIVQILSLHIGLLALIMIVLVVVIDRCFKKS